MATTGNTGDKKSPTKKKRTSAPRAPRKTAKVIRNLRGTPVNMRLGNPKDPFRIKLARRGLRGDTAVVPANLQDDLTFTEGDGLLFEVLTTAEAKALEYAPVGYKPPVDTTLTILRDVDQNVHTAPDWDGERGTRPPHLREPGVDYVNVPGSDEALHEKLNAQKREGATPENADFSRRNVTIQRTRQQ